MSKYDNNSPDSIHAGGIGAVFIAIVCGLGRFADDGVRVACRSSKAVSRTSLNSLDDFARNGVRHADDSSPSTFHLNHVSIPHFQQEEFQLKAVDGNEIDFKEFEYHSPNYCLFRP